MKMKVELYGKRKFNIKIGNFKVITDLPREKGGEETGPTPSELFVASLGSCVALYCVNYLDTAGLDPSELSADIEWDFSEDRPSRVDKVSISLKIPHAELGKRKNAVLAAAKSCTIHNTLQNPPEITISVEGK
jgi:uncharacterized OsmC-like protein